MINFDVYAIIIQMLLLRKNLIFQFDVDYENKHGYLFAFGEINCLNSSQEKKIFFDKFNIINGNVHSILHFGEACENNNYKLHFMNKPLINSEWEIQTATFNCPKPNNELTSLNNYSIKLKELWVYNWEAICEQKNNSTIFPLESFPKIIEYENNLLNLQNNIQFIMDPLKKELIKILFDNSKRNLEKLNEKQLNVICIIIRLIGEYTSIFPNPQQPSGNILERFLSEIINILNRYQLNNQLENFGGNINFKNYNDYEWTKSLIEKQTKMISELHNLNIINNRNNILEIILKNISNLLNKYLNDEKIINEIETLNLMPNERKQKQKLKYDQNKNKGEDYLIFSFKARNG
uniref:Uncharacterized protein n=1 Tax=Meloidogyne floridensis TaxID=298350 RepID=A0A915P2C8_9BILA